MEVISCDPEDDPVVQGVEIPVNNNSPLQDFIHPDNHLLLRWCIFFFFWHSHLVVEENAKNQVVECFAIL